VRRRLHTALALLALTGLLAPVAARAEMEVYHPRHRTAEDLLPLAETALGAEGRVAVDPHTNALVLIGSDEAVAQALELLALQDRRLRSMLVEHETRSASELEAAGFRIVWSAGGGSVRVGNVVRPEASGGALVLHDRRASTTSSSVGALRVLEGEWGRIAQGSEILLPVGSHLHPDAVRVAAESGIEVRPRVLGDGRVRLDLRPFQGQLRDDGSIAYTGAETTLVVAPGETAVVGGIASQDAGRSRSLAGGTSQGSGRREELLLVTVTLDDVPGAAAPEVPPAGSGAR
jgi:type II secretory pathway component GspD/PulD (secretin)